MEVIQLNLTLNWEAINENDVFTPMKASPITSKDLFTLGEKVQTELVDQKATGPLFEFSPEIDHYLKVHLFGNISADDRLTHQEREIVAIKALIT
ncbi:hypothetical protein [Pantoea sp.]|uniref:hypothetical protein n=1 Tax=Pantoea sp. TaxID=69393 RepID=UPI0028A98508|nr:hypothetical protein [Pantoea sp.]